MTKRPTQRGFTLLELLVAMVLFALVSGAVYGAIRLVSRAADATERLADDGERLRILGDFLDRYVGQALSLVETRNTRRNLLFVGERERLVLVTELPELTGQPAPHEVVLEMGGPRNRTLMIGYRSLAEGLGGDFGRGDYRWRALTRAVADLRLEYYGQTGTTEPAEWRDEWREESRLPLLVRFFVSPDDDGEWPSIVVKLQTDGLRAIRERKDRS